VRDQSTRDLSALQLQMQLYTITQRSAAIALKQESPDGVTMTTLHTEGWTWKTLLLGILLPTLAAFSLHAANSTVALDSLLAFTESDDDEWSTYMLTTSYDWSGSTVYLPNSYFGYYSLTVSGAILKSSQMYIGDEADYNVITLTGSSTQWTNSSYLYVGRKGGNNALTITGGATFATQYAYIGKSWFENTSGAAYSADSNAVTVDGSGSLLTVSSALYVGGAGSYNTMTVTNGGAVVDHNATIGASSEATSNSVLVSGSGSTWSTKYDLVVGDMGHYSNLTVSNGGTVTSNTLTLAKSAGSYNNSVIVSGSGSTLSVSGSVIIGLIGSGNSVTVTNGGKLYSGSSTLGGDSQGFTTTNNTALVSGQGSVWTAKTLTIYSGNTLTVEDGGLLKITSSLTLQSGGYIEIDGGYLAWKGDQSLTFQSLVEAGNFQVYNSSTGKWETVTDTSLFSIEYVSSSDDSSLLTDGIYTDLAGYTVLGLAETDSSLLTMEFTALRISLDVVPEPSTWAMFVLAFSIMGAVYAVRVQNVLYGNLRNFKGKENGDYGQHI
jgi:T5SS/PEP-CTERM-associated repeat protein